MTISSSSQFPPVIHLPYSPLPVSPSVNKSKTPEQNDDATDDKGSGRSTRSTNSASTISELSGSSASGSGSSQPAANSASVVNGYIDKLEQSSADSEQVFAQKPGLMQKLTEKFTAKYPNVPRPVDLNKIYVNSYQNTWIPRHNDENGVHVPGKHVRTFVSSKSVADWMADKYASGKGVNPLDNDILENSTLGRGMYSDPTAIEQGDEIKGVSVRDLQRFLDEPGVGDDLEQTAIDQNNAYYSQPNSQTDGLSVKQWLANTRNEQLGTEAELRTADGTLEPKHKKLIDTVRANPTPAELETLPADQRPIVTPLSIRMSQNLPYEDAPIPGAYFMSTPQAAGEGSGDDTAAVVLVIPGEGLRKFDSEAALHRYISARSGHPEERKSLLNLLPAQQRSFVGEKIFTLSPSDAPRPQIAANQNFFEYSVQGQIDQENVDIRYEFQQAKAQHADLNVFDAIGKSSNASLRQSFDTKEVLHERTAQLLEANSPAWRQNATPGQLRALEDAEKKREASEEKLRDVMAKKNMPPLREYAKGKVDAAIEQKYPGWRIYPDQVTVKTTELTPALRSPGGAGGSSTSPLPTTDTKQVSVVDYFLGNNPPWDAKSQRREVSVTLIDSKGNQRTLSSDEITQMVTDLNVGQAYQDELKEIFLSPGGQDIRDAWKEYYAAKMDVDATEAKLRGVFSEDNPERPAYAWVTTVRNYPDATTRPKVDGKEIQADSLVIGGTPPDYRDGFSVDGVLVVGPKNGPVVLYTPDAPDGVTMQPFASRQEMAQSPRLRTPEMVAYLKARVSENGQAEVAKLGGPATQGRFRGPTTVGTFEISGNVQDRMYEAHVKMLIANANTQSTTNSERNSQSALNIFNTTVDVVNYFLMIPGGGKIASGVRGLFRSPSIRSQLSKLKTLPRLFKNRGARGEDTIALLPRSRTSSSSSSASSLNSRRLSADIDPTKLKSIGNGIFADLATNKQYLLYRSSWVETFAQDGKRFMRDPQNPSENIEIKQIGGDWVPQLPEAEALPANPSKTIAERNAELPTDIASRPFDENALKHYRIDLINYLFAEGNEETFSNLLNIMLKERVLTREEYDAISSKSHPLTRAIKFLNILGQKDPAVIAKFPGYLRQAVRNGSEAASAAEYIKNLATQQKTNVIKINLDSFGGLDHLPEGATRKPGNLGIYDSLDGKAYIKIDEKWYTSNTTSSGQRYIEHPTQKGNRYDVKSLGNDKWEALPRGGVGGGLFDIVLGRTEVILRGQGGGTVTLNKTKYPNIFSVNGDKNLLISGERLRTNAQGITTFESAETEKAFLAFKNARENGTAKVYRGFSTNHFSMGELKTSGILKSEGIADNPTFTMGNNQPTRWLPTAPEMLETVGIALGNESNFLMAKGSTVPYGVIVEIPAGKNVKATFLNPGETLIDGPLTADKYQIKGVVFMDDRRGLIIRTFDGIQASDLPKPRPYRTSGESDPAYQARIDAWVDDIQQDWFPKFSGHDITEVPI